MSKKRARTYARNRTAISRRGNLKHLIFDEPDGVYVLKLVLLLVISSFWIRLHTGQGANTTLQSLPIGVLLAFLLARQFEKNPLNRRIWYLLIIVVGLISYFLPAGIVI